MGFNYASEKRRFDAEWTILEKQYRDAGFDESGIKEMYDFDWKWFCQRRTYENRVQPLPSEFIDNSNTKNNSPLLGNYDSLSTVFCEEDFTGRYDWIMTLSDSELSYRVERLSDEEKELLTLLVFDGYRQREIAEILSCAQSTISKRLASIKKFLR